MALKSITITDSQTLFDVALQYYGDASKATEIVKLNSNIPDLLFNGLSGMVIVVDEQNNDTVNYYKNKNIKISTRFPEITLSKGFDSGFDKGFN